MIIICNEKEYQKKKLDKIYKIVISSKIKVDDEEPKIIALKQLMTPMKLMHDFYNDILSYKKYKKKYFEYLESEQIYTTILTMLLTYKQHKKLCFVCTEEEKQFKYMQMLLEYLNDKFKVKSMTYEKYKKSTDVDFTLDKSILNKEVMKNFNNVFGDEIVESKSKKKPNKKKKKLAEKKSPIKLKQISIQRV